MSKHPEPTPHEAPTPESLAHKDDELRVPKGRSRAQFFIIIGLMIFTLIIFVVPDQFRSMFQRGDPAEREYFVWNHPQAGRQVFNARDFDLATLELRRVIDAFQVIDPKTFRPDNTLKNQLKGDEQIGRMLVLDRLAQDAGIEIPDTELAGVIKDGGLVFLSLPERKEQDELAQFVISIAPCADSAALRQLTSYLHIAPVDYQEALRWMLRVQRFEALLGCVAEPEPSGIEQAWKEQHKEHSFEFVAVDPEALRPEAEAAAPDEAALRTWFDALDAGKKRGKFGADYKPERISAEFVLWKFDETADMSKLLERYPRPEGADLEKLAQDYYNQFQTVRFLRPEPMPSATTESDRLYLPFDAVVDRARAESKVHAALVDMSIEMQGKIRAGTAEPQWSELAAGLGLQWIREDEPRTLQEWNEYVGVGSQELSGKLKAAAHGDQFVPLTVGKEHVSFGRALQRRDEAPPSFDEVKDKALVEWKNDKVAELALAKNQAFTDLLKAVAPTVGEIATPSDTITADTATFAAKAQGLGLAVQSTGWIDATKLTPSFSETANDLDRVLQEVAISDMMFQYSKRSGQPSGASLVEAPADTVTLPRAPSGTAKSFYVRKAGTRDPEQVVLAPKDYSQLARNAASKRADVVRDDWIGLKAMQARFAMEFPGRVKTEEPVVPPPPPSKSGS